MGFSIPQTINPVYSVPNTSTLTSQLKVGAAIKDLAPGTETTMKKAHDASLITLTEKYEADTALYEKNFKAAEVNAAKAQKVVDRARRDKAIAVTFLALSILFLIGVGIAAAATGTLPILFGAIPCVAVLIPSSIYTNILSKKVAKLEKEIAAPGVLQKPELQLPVYHSNKDYELLQSRIDAQNLLSSMTVKEMVESGIHEDEIVNYGLLDRVTVINAENRPVFYAKCVQLIKSYGQIVGEYSKYSEQSKSEFNKLDRELRLWKTQQDDHIRTREWELREQERTQAQINEARRHGQPVAVRAIGTAATILSRIDLENMKREVANGYLKRDAANHSWNETTMSSVKTSYRDALRNVEEQYTAAKTAAA
jgi:hypothetical protein